MRLGPSTLDRVHTGVARPVYDRDARGVGILHFGLGAFHRAHQAVYTDEAMAAGPGDWAITGVSLRSPAARDALAPQDGLYSVTQRSPDGEAARVIGAVQSVLVAAEDPGAVVAALASPGLRIVSLTVTEAGYCRAVDGGLDRAAAGSVAAPTSVHGYLAAGLDLRRARGLPGLTLLSCDNLAGNGAVLAALLGAFLDDHDPALARWFARECACPSSMVDRIVPAATPDTLTRAAAALGLDDAAALATEPFRQWVIEDRFAGQRPAWEAAGVVFAADVGPYETAKLRMLNGAHSALAYLGLERGLTHVHQAIADPVIRPLVETLIRDEATTSFAPATGQDLDVYADSLLRRFANTALPHALAQIAMDGSQKIPQRWLATLNDQGRRGRACPAILRALAAWIACLKAGDAAPRDPMAGPLRKLATTLDAPALVDGLFGERGLFAAHWRATAADRAILIDHLLAD